MRFLRRDNAESTDNADEAEVAPASEEVGKGFTPAKGRPTPKRRDAESRKRGPVAPPPRTQREAMKRSRGNKEDRRKASADRRARMMAGDDRVLLSRDRGPVRAHVRDLVDSQRRIVGLFLPFALVLVLGTFLVTPQTAALVNLLLLAMVVLMLVDGVLLGRSVTRRVRVKFPSATDRGLSLGWYSFGRAMQPRKLRMPRPKVKPGEQVS